MRVKKAAGNYACSSVILMQGLLQSPVRQYTACAGTKFDDEFLIPNS